MNRIEYTFGKNIPENINLIKLALQENLYIEGWTLKNILVKFLETPSKQFYICLALDNTVPENSIPVGVVVCLFYGQMMFFVKKEFRRLGIGRELYKSVVQNVKKPINGFYSERGTNESISFFDDMDICVME